jgi:hypothetical protein
MREDPLFNIVPGYRQAVEDETATREAAFLGVTELVCGVEVLPFSPLHFSMLECARSPFVKGGVPSPADVAIFLWAVSPGYAPRAKIRRWLFARRVAGLDYLNSLSEIQSYIQDAFGDAPGVKMSGFKPSYYSGTAAMIDLIASQYGWSEEQIIRIPFKRIFQYARCIRERTSDNPIFFNRSDAVIGRWQEEQNASAGQCGSEIAN